MNDHSPPPAPALPDPPALPDELAALRARIGRAHLRHRLGLEDEDEARVFRRGTPWIHLENWLAAPSLLRALLAVSGLRARGRRNTRRLQVRTHEAWLPRLPAAFDGFRLLQLSDLHLDVPDGEAYRAALSAHVRELPHDACVLTGDFRFRTRGPFEPAMQAMAALRPVLASPCFAVLGNHDTLRMVPRLEAMDVRVLLNESASLERDGQRLHLAGIDDAHYYRAHGLHKAADAVPDDACCVLLSHTPEPWRAAAHCGFDLMLCGHTHGGQVCLPGGWPLVTDSDAPRRFARGPWRHGAMRGYTSVGCGSSIVDVRFNCPPEITVHVLRRGGEARTG